MEGTLIESRKTGPVRWTSAQWCAYYRSNGRALLDIPWEEGARLTEAERAAVAASLQDFQLGESSDGRNLLRAAAAYAEAIDDPHYLEAIRLFIAEEQRHAGDLGKFLTLAGIPLLTQTWRDGVFRWLRRRAGLELFLMVLVTAEMIGKIYYKAVHRATRSTVLRRLCAQLLRDEIKHIRFHVERLAQMRQGRARWKVWLARAWHRCLLGGSCLVVWFGHRRALRAGGYGFRRFWSEVWQEMARALRPIDPQDFALPEAGRPLVPVGV